MTDLPPAPAATRPEDELVLTPGLIHLNHAGVGPWPRRAVEAVRRFAEENGRQGSERYAEWLAVEQRLRGRLARLVGAAAPEDIALAKSTSEALSVVAYGLDWQPGDSVVGIAEEFPSNRIVWESLADRGVTWRGLSLAESADPEADLLARCDGSTRLVAVSWVQYARGLKLDLPRLAAGCRARGILLCVDAIQGLGAVPGDLAGWGADFVAADGHKWMLGPEGLALFYVRPELRECLRLNQFGWGMVERRGDFDRGDWAPARDARRFECGSPNFLGIFGLEASLSLLDEMGMEAVAAAVDARVERLIGWVDRLGLTLLSPREPARRAGIVTFRAPEADPQVLYRGLMARRILCAQRAGGIRFSPHFYTPPAHLDRAMETVATLLAGRVAR